MVKKYCNKPATIEAIIYDGTNKVAVQQFMRCYLDENTINKKLKIPTLGGDMWASQGDYIIKGVKGEFYPCKPDIFAETYREKSIFINLMQKLRGN